MLPQHLVCKYELNYEYCNIILARNKAPWWRSDMIETCRSVLKCFKKCFIWNYMCIRWLMNWSDFNSETLKSQDFWKKRRKLHSAHVIGIKQMWGTDRNKEYFTITRDTNARKQHRAICFTPHFAKEEVGAQTYFAEYLTRLFVPADFSPPWNDVWDQLDTINYGLLIIH